MQGSLWIAALGSALLAALAVATPASADWPTSRHDGSRSGASTTGADIKKPAAYWRSQLGGALSSGQMYIGDVNQDGTDDVLFVAGGELVLASPDGSILWRTSSRGFGRIVGVVDLDGDGQLDVVVATGSSVSIVSGASGDIEWVEPPGELGTPGAFRIGDVEGNGSPDLWLDTCGCCAIESGSPGIIYSFAGGFMAPVKLGPPPARSHCGAASDTLVDLDGDGILDMVVMSNDTATAFRGGGVVLGTSDMLPGYASSASCEAVNLDGQPGDELVCFTNSVGAGAGERGLFALGYHPAETPALKLLWNTTVSVGDGGDAQAPTALTADLDGDGLLEAIVSGQVNGSYTTFVLDAATGAQLASVDGVAVGDVVGATPGQRWVLVTSGAGVSAFSFVRNPPALGLAWQVPGMRPSTTFDWTSAALSNFQTSLLTPDLNGDGHPDLVLSSIAEPTLLIADDTSQGAPSALGQYALDPGVSVSSTAPGSAASLFVARNDGFVLQLGGTLAPQNQSLVGSILLPRLFVGGYYTGPGGLSYGLAPIAGKLLPTDPAEALLVVDSRGDLVRIDPTGASNVAPAQAKWRLPDSFGAGMRPAGAGPAALGVFRRRHPVTVPPVYVMATIDANGQEIASLQLPRPPLWDVVPGDFLGDGSTSFVGLDVDASLNTDVTVMTAAGVKLWQTPVVNVAGTQPVAVADWNGDGADDVATFINVAHVYSGKTGVELASGSDALYYYMPVLADLDEDGQLDMLLQGGYYPVRGLNHDLTQSWGGTGTTAPYPYGSLVGCPQGPTLIEGSDSAPSQLDLTLAGGPTAGAANHIILASGETYMDTASATAAGAQLGQLGDVAVSADLAGDSAGPTALVGSTDGYLYALDACAGTLRWSLAFHSPVGAPVLADTDGDGKDEILVSVADGYLYALKNEVLPAPAFVWDTDRPAGIYTDVASIVTENTLYATWGAVAGATSYEVAVVVQEGTYITSPSWADVGLVTSAAIGNLKLVDGSRYFIGVRGVSAAGKSPDTPSNGVVVHLPAPDGGSGNGGSGGAAGAGGAPNLYPIYGRACSCATPGAPADGPLALLAALLLGGAAWRRGRRGAGRGHHA